MKKQKSTSQLAHERAVLQQARRILIIYFGIPLATLIIWTLWMGSSYAGISTKEGMEFAQLARHISSGSGFVTSIIRPLSLSFCSATFPMPDLMNAPLFALIESFLFIVGGPTDRMAAFASGTGWMITILFVYLLTKRITASRKAASLAVLFLFLNVPLLNLAIIGQPYTWTMALVTALFWVLSRSFPREDEVPQSAPIVPALLSGICCGLICLADYSLVMVVSIPALLFWIRWVKTMGYIAPRGRHSTSRRDSPMRFIRQNRGFHLSMLFILSLCLTTLPWLIRNATLTGNPLFTLSTYNVMCFSKSYPFQSIFRHTIVPEVTPFFYILFNIMGVLRQSLLALTPLPFTWAKLFNPVLLMIFVMSIFVPGDKPQKSLLRTVLLMLLLAVIVFSVRSTEFIHFAAFSGVITALASSFLYTFLAEYTRRTSSAFKRTDPASGFSYWLRKMSRYYRKDLILLLVLFLAALPFVSSRLTSIKRKNPTMPLGMEYLSNLDGDQPVIITDAPWALAWYGQQTAMWIPQTLKDYQYLTNELAITPEWIYLLGFRNMKRAEIDPWWIDLVKQPGEPWANYQPDEALTRMEMLRRRNDIKIAPAKPNNEKDQ